MSYKRSYYSTTLINIGAELDRREQALSELADIFNNYVHYCHNGADPAKDCAGNVVMNAEIATRQLESAVCKAIGIPDCALDMPLPK